MSEVLTIVIRKHRNGARLTWLYDSEVKEAYCIDETVDSIIDQLKQGYMDFVFPHSIDGETLSDFKGVGSNQVSNNHSTGCGCGHT